MHGQICKFMLFLKVSQMQEMIFMLGRKKKKKVKLQEKCECAHVH